MNNIDEIFDQVGHLGFQQWKYVIAANLVHVYYAFHMLLYTFVARKLDFTCKTNAKDGPCSPGCLSGYDFLSTETSIVSDWDLVCESEGLRPLTMSLFMFGVMIGAVVLGIVSDTVGRKPTTFATLLSMIITNQFGAWTDSFPLYCASRVFNGFFCGGHILSLFVLYNELLGSSRRGMAAALMSTTWSLGIIILCGLAYQDQNWRSLTTTISLLGFPVLLLYPCIPESPRWLASKRRLEEANHVLRNIAKGNGNAIDDKFLLTYDSMDHSAKGSPEDLVRETAQLRDLFRYPSTSVMTIILLYSWFVTSSSYFGLTLVAGNDTEDLYLATAFSCAVEIPGSFFATFLLAWVGRKKPLCGFLISAGVGLLSIPLLVAAGMSFLASSIALFGKLCAAASFTIVYVHSSEIFPTPIRNSGMGLVAVASRLGGILSPYFALLGDYVTNLHLILFGCLALTAGIANLKLPETLGKPLPEDMQDLLNLLGDRKRRAGKKTTRSRTTSNTSDNQQYTLLSLEDASDSD